MFVCLFVCLFVFFVFFSFSFCLFVCCCFLFVCFFVVVFCFCLFVFIVYIGCPWKHRIHKNVTLCLVFLDSSYDRNINCRTPYALFLFCFFRRVHFF